MRNTLLLAALVTIAPTVTANTLTVEQILTMQQARNEAHAAQERSDNSLIRALCQDDPSETCLTATRKLVESYKKAIIDLHESDKRFTSALSGQTGAFDAR